VTALPATISGTFQGTAQAFEDSMRGLGWILVLAIFVIYVVLGVLVRKLHPSADDSLGACRRRASARC
jgi:HAE1 family hydrophobic/amphiphilic exporter-1